MSIALQVMQPGDTSDTFPTLTITSCVHYYLPLLQALTRLWENEQLKQHASDDVQDEDDEDHDEDVAEGGGGRGISSLVGIVDCFSSLIMLTKYEGNPHTKAGTGLNRRAILLIALREVDLYYLRSMFSNCCSFRNNMCECVSLNRGAFSWIPSCAPAKLCTVYSQNTKTLCCVC